MLTLSTSATFEFSSTDAQGHLRWGEDPTRTGTAPNIVFLRLYPGAADKVVATSGGLASVGSDIAQVEGDMVVFTGGRTASLANSGVTDVTIQKVGAYFNRAGEDVTVAFTFDAARQLLKASEPCYGVVKVSYNAPYRLYRFSFAGRCETAYIPGQGMVTSGGWEAATVIAIDFARDVAATINMTPPACTGDNDVQVLRASEAKLPGLRLEVHKDYPPRLGGPNSAGTELTAECRIRIVPDTGADVVTSTGAINGEADSGSELVREAATFSGSGSINLQYQPSSSVSVSALGSFFDFWGNTVSPTFLTPGETALEVDWSSESAYTNPRPRTVREDEIVAVDWGGRVIAVYGGVEVHYSITYKVYSLAFDRADTGDLGKGWKVAHVAAFSGEQTAYLQITPPTMKE